MDDDDTKPLQSHSATQDPPIPPPADNDPPPEPKNENPEEDGDYPPETARESKRRRLCPTALDKCGDNSAACFSNSSNCFSFSFDPKFSFGVSTPEVTPKFGSFKLLPDGEGGAASKSGKEAGEKEKRELVKDDDGEDDEDGIGISTEDYLEEGSNLFL